MIKKVVIFFDKLEDKIRIKLSRHPVVYAIIGAIGIILVWKGVEDTAEIIGLTGPSAFFVGLVMLLLTGLLVTFFIGDSIILSGLKKEKKIVEKTEVEVKAEQTEMEYVVEELDHIERELQGLKSRL